MSIPKRKNKFIPTQFSEHQVFGYRSEEQLKKDGVWNIMPDWAKAKVRARDTEEWVKSFGKKRKSKLWKLDENEPIPY